MTKLSQCRRILVHLRRAPITPLQAIHWMGVLRLGARIYDLRQAGNKIHGKTKRVRNRRGEWCHVTEYTLVAEATNINVRKAS